jgi:hypothetical protein
MLNLLLGRRLKHVVENDILDAKLMISTMKLKLYKEGAESTRILGEGVGEVAGLLAQRFGIFVPDALAARGLTWQQLDDAARDLMSGAEKIARISKARSCPSARLRISKLPAVWYFIISIECVS